MELFNTVMDAVDNIGIELQNNYNDAQAVVETLNISKSEIVQLIEKLDMVINVGNEDLEKYQNSDIDDPLKFKKIELATKSLISLKKSKNQLSVSLQEKDLKIINLSGEIVAIMDWMVTGYPALSHQVENRIETKYISNRINDLIELNETTNKIILDGANELKTTTTNTMELLKKGSLDVATLNSYLKTVQEALKPVQGYIENKENIEKKLIAELDRMDQEIMKNNEVLGLISSSNVTPSIEAPKKLTLEMKNSNNA